MPKLFYRILAIYAGLIFTLVMLVCIPFMLITDVLKEPQKSIWFLKISKAWNYIFIYLTGSSIKVMGKENFAKGENYIVLYNHNSYMDVPISCPFTPAPNKTIGRNEFMKIPVMNIVYKRGSVLLDRNSKTSKIASYHAMRKVLDNNMNMCIYPEGTRNRTNEPLLSFKPGAFRLAVETGKSIIPSIITGTRNALPPTESLYYKPSKFSLTFFAPISPVGKTEEQLMEECYRIMKQAYLEAH
jgi:1-acyl-sn-glycerol-3-phosphate acyltransferase